MAQRRAVRLQAMLLFAATLLAAAVRPAAGTTPLLAPSGPAMDAGTEQSSAAANANYRCDPASCLPAKNCACPSTQAPGGLPTKQIPQFVLLTHDDAVTEEAHAVVRELIDKYKNPNGCRLVATWFVLQTETVPSLVNKLYSDGHEIACHTVTHPFMKRNWTGNAVEEIVSILYDNGFAYESSVNDYVPSPLSPSVSQRTWPFTYDAGIPFDCAYTYPIGRCKPDERYPGLWEMTMLDLVVPAGVTYKGYNLVMDYDAADTDQASGGRGGAVHRAGRLYKFLVSNFEDNYQGNRAPFGIYLHMPWFKNTKNADKPAALRRFVEYSLKKGDVYYVTVQQLLWWMKNPVPVSSLKTQLQCQPGATPLLSAARAAPPPPVPSPSPPPPPTTQPGQADSSTVAFPPAAPEPAEPAVPLSGNDQGQQQNTESPPPDLAAPTPEEPPSQGLLLPESSQNGAVAAASSSKGGANVVATSSPDASSSSSFPVAVVVGAVAGGLVAVVAGLVAFRTVRRKRQRAEAVGVTDAASSNGGAVAGLEGGVGDESLPTSYPAQVMRAGTRHPQLRAVMDADIQAVIIKGGSAPTTPTFRKGVPAAP
eukprot:scaffold1.g5368.t1